MKLRNLLRLFVLALALVTSAAPAPKISALDEVSMLAPQVRLRKLHLVRPDLIHYPLSVEVVC